MNNQTQQNDIHIGRWIAGFVVLTLIILAAIWLATKVDGTNAANDINGALTGNNTAEEQLATAQVASSINQSLVESQATEIAQLQAEVAAVSATTVPTVVVPSVTPMPTVTVMPTATPAPTQVPIIVPDNCDVADDGTWFVCFPSTEGPQSFTVPEGGFALVAAGSVSVNGNTVSPVSEDTGHIVLAIGTSPDGETPDDLNRTLVVDDYVPGHIAVTVVFKATPEEARKAAQDAMDYMMDPENSNCGDAGCNKVFIHEMSEVDGFKSMLEVTLDKIFGQNQN